jgi:PBP4 family serine-type D-alanyl-D-alanine carboxypeptidase
MRLLAAAAAPLVVGCAINWSPCAVASQPATMDQIAKRINHGHAIVAAEVYDLDRKRVLYSHSPSILMEAASTTKLITEGISLALLGPDFRFVTPVYRTGPVSPDGTLEGNLVLVASGDPNLSQRVQNDGSLAYTNEDHSYDSAPHARAVSGDPLVVLRQLADQVFNYGIRSIHGDVLMDASLFPDAGVEYGTGSDISAIILNDNLVDVTVAASNGPGTKATISVSPSVDYVQIKNEVTTGAKGSASTVDFSSDDAQADGSHIVAMSGAQPGGTSSFHAYRVSDPPAFARSGFIRALRDRGIRLSSGAESTPRLNRTPSSLVAEHISPPLREDVRVTLKVSQNLHAAVMPFLWGVYRAKAHRHVATAGFNLARNLLSRADLDLGSAAQQDGYGLGAFFTPSFMVRYLAWAAMQPWFPWFKRALPVLGVDGTLSRIERTSMARGKVFAKTGTFVFQNRLGQNDILTTKGLAGYMTTRHGRHLAFCFYVNRVQLSGGLSADRVNGELGSWANAVYEAF